MLSTRPRRPVVVLNRISSEEINRLIGHEENNVSVRQPVVMLDIGMNVDENVINGNSNEIDHVMTNMHFRELLLAGHLNRRNERLVFERYEFLNGDKQSTRLLFVHDIEHLYFYRYKSSKGAVVIDALGMCKAVLRRIHIHPFVKPMTI